MQDLSFLEYSDGNGVLEFSNAEIGKQKINELKMLPEEECIDALKLVSQMSDFILKYGSLPVSSSFDLSLISLTFIIIHLSL